MKSLCLSGFIVLAAVVGVFAQAQPVREVKGGILNGRAISLPKPEYPEAAKAAKIGGFVVVDVLIDENGNVIEAVAEPNDGRTRTAPDGTKLDPVPVDQSLRDAAEATALLARYTPTRLSGEPVRVRGKIVYNFVADNSDKPPRVGEIYGPSLNDQAVSLPTPVYPQEARAAGVQGVVTVYVKADEDGNVLSAKATSGPPMLRGAAEEAAMQAKFKLSRIAGQPVRFAGVVTYTFSMSDRKDQ